MIQAQRTVFPSHVVRQAAFRRLAHSHPHMNYSDWLGLMRGRFEAAHPQHRRPGEDSRLAFDRWLERQRPAPEGAAQ